MKARLDWPAILSRGAEIVRSYSTPVTLRQLFYRLVAEGAIPNTRSAYSTLSRVSARARRENGFPALADHTRSIQRYQAFADTEDARSWLARIYRRDRTERQELNVYLGVEKATLTSQLQAWFGGYGVPLVALRGYSSQTLADDVREDAEADGRPAVLLYAGDFDATGEDIPRDFTERADCFDRVVRVALTPEQVAEYGLPPQPGKAADSRAPGFVARHGELVQVELEALAPEDLRQLYQDAIAEHFDLSAWEAVLEREEAERGELEGRA